jgi:signal transduction histidine kinase
MSLSCRAPKGSAEVPKVLLVDDDEDDFVITRDVVAEIPGKLGFDWERDFDAGLAIARKATHDVLLLDYRLGDRNGIDFLHALRESGSQMPVIVLTGAADREVDVKAMNAGATDFLPKANLSAETLDRAIRYALSVRELTQRLLDEHQRLLRSDKLSSIGLLAASVAHEVNNPLGGVINLVKSLRDNAAMADTKRAEYFDAVQDGLERMRTTVQGLLDFSRERPLTMSKVDVGEMIGALLSLTSGVFRKKTLTVDNRIPAGQTFVRGDRSQLMQALINLLLNAAHATPRQGTVQISVERRPDKVGISIADTGPGIPKEIADRIFEPFFTTKPPGEGTGLGLAIVRSIVKAHGGEFTLESHAGTIATLWLSSDGPYRPARRNA